MIEIRKYPRTHHILDSRLQPGDEDLDVTQFDALAGRHLVVEEKVDGANSAISFDATGSLLLQSRGHYLTGGPRERHFALLKSWASSIAPVLAPVLGNRFVVYGEWLFAKHTIFYDALPHFFLEFDVLDRKNNVFLSTPERRQLLKGVPLSSVPVLHQGVVPTARALKAMIGRSNFKSPDWRNVLSDAAGEKPHRPEMVMKQTDPSDLMEGLYIKLEEDGRVTGRYKYVRHDFLTTVLDSDSHWHTRPILKNRLSAAADMTGF